jgi:hypothetical protein
MIAKARTGGAASLDIYFDEPEGQALPHVHAASRQRNSLNIPIFRKPFFIDTVSRFFPRFITERL